MKTPIWAARWDARNGRPKMTKNFKNESECAAFVKWKHIVYGIPLRNQVFREVVVPDPVPEVTQQEKLIFFYLT
jgi:hypothetical protein